MPIAAFGGGALGAYALSMIQWFGMKFHGGYSEDGWMYLYILPVISSAIFGWLYVYISCTLAPRGKAIAGIVMTTILVTICIISTAIVWFHSNYSPGEAIQKTAGSISTIFASVVSMIQMYGEHREVES